MRFGARYFDESGYISGGTGTYRLRDKLTGEIYDFSTGAWAAAPVTPDASLTEDPADAGYYRGADLTITAWGTRRISFSYLLTKGGETSQSGEEEIAVLSGAEALSVSVVAPPAGDQVAVLFVRTSAGAIPSTAPSAACNIISPLPPADCGPVTRTGTWNAANGTWSWNVPEDSVIEIVSVGAGVSARYEVEDETLVVNTATPV